MNLLEIIYDGGQLPEPGSDVVVNNNARNPDNRRQLGWIREYEVHIVLYNTNREVRVTAKSVDVVD